MVWQMADLNLEKTPDISPYRANYGVPILSIWEELDHFVTEM